jgi:hypothetical protein
MRRLRLSVLALLTLLPTIATADLLIGDRSGSLPLPVGNHDASIWRVSTPDDVVVARARFPVAEYRDMVVAPDGWLYVAAWGISVSRYSVDGVVEEADWLSPFHDAYDIAVESAGNLIVLDRAYGFTQPSGIYRVSLARDVELVDSIPGFNMMGMDVPRAGPFEDGIIVIGFDDDLPDASYWLWRYVRQPDASLVREGPFGPLDVTPFDTCQTTRGFVTIHPTARWGRPSFVAVEGCSERILEFDYDGNLLGTFAMVGPDPEILAPTPGDPTAVFEDRPTNIFVAPNDDVYVTSWRRLYHFDPEGNLLRKVDWVFNQANAITSAEWIPFQTAGATCEPRSMGYWKRQCLGEDRGQPMLQDSRRGRSMPPGPGVHPTFRGGGLPTLVERVDRRISTWGVTACEALWPSEPSEPRARALRKYAAVLFNFEAKRLHVRCPVTIEGTEVTAGAVLERIDELLTDDTDDSYREASRLAAALLGSDEE